MIRDRHVFVAACLRRFGHFFDGVSAIRLDRVHVHIALQVRLRDEAGQGMVLRQVDLAQVLAHLGRDVVEFELVVDFLFRFSGDGLLALQRGQAVLVQRVAHLQGALA